MELEREVRELRRANEILRGRDELHAQAMEPDDSLPTRAWCALGQQPVRKSAEGRHPPSSEDSLFFKSANGARVADLCMSIIHTCELADANAFEYLVALQRHAEAVALDPAGWMPWNYVAALERIEKTDE